MKLVEKTFDGRNFLLLLPETAKENAALKSLGKVGSKTVAVMRESDPRNVYLRLEVPAAAAETEKSGLLNSIPISYCESCKAEVLWLMNDSTGKFAPIDALPAENGNCYVYSKTHYRVLAGDGLNSARAAGSKLNANHFLTCPNADDFRPKRKK